MWSSRATTAAAVSRSSSAARRSSRISWPCSTGRPRSCSCATWAVWAARLTVLPGHRPADVLADQAVPGLAQVAVVARHVHAAGPGALEVAMAEAAVERGMDHGDLRDPDVVVDREVRDLAVVVVEVDRRRARMPGVEARRGDEGGLGGSGGEGDERDGRRGGEKAAHAPSLI